MRLGLISLILTLASLCSPALAGPKAVMLVVGSASLSDLSAPDLPNFSRMFSGGSIGLMNSRTAGTPSGEPSSTGYEAACLTLGAGTRAVGGWAVSKAYNRGEKVNWMTASQVWSARTLLSEPEAQVVQPHIVRIASDNSQAKYQIAAGALGESIRKAGLKTAVVGNSDTPSELHREAAAIAMDESGLVDFGVVGKNLCVRDPSAPFGVAASHRAYVRALDAVWEADFIVIDPGDTLRAEMYAGYCSKQQASEHKQWAIRRADTLLGNLMEWLDPEKDLLIVLSPNPGQLAAGNGEMLSPVLVRGPGFTGGLLSSASTRWEGVLTNLDIAPTIGAFLGIAPSESMVGRAAFAVPAVSATEKLQKLNLKLASRTRSQPISRWICIFLVIVVLVVTACLLFVKRKARLLSRLALLPAAVVLSALVAPLLGRSGLVPNALVIGLLSVVLAAGTLVVWKNAARALAALCLMLTAGLIIDIFTGSTLLRTSVLSYSASEGARYYGIGNEFMGALIGAAVVGTGLLLSQWKIGGRKGQFICTAVLGAVTLVIAAPVLGANTGGAMSVVAAVLVALRLRSGRPIRMSQVALIALAVAAAVGALILIDSVRGGGQSHMGRFGSAIASGGIEHLCLVFERKLAMNFMLLESSVWSRLMLAAGAGIALLWAHPKTGTGSGLKRSTELFAGVAAAVTGAAAAFAFNDSGVVAAGICLTYPWAAAVLVSLPPEDDRI